MKLYVFALRFPALYTPYLDDQYSDLVVRGHDLTFVADSSFLPGPPTPVQRELIARARYFDFSVAAGRASATRSAITGLATDPVARILQLTRAEFRGGLRSRVGGALRILNLPIDPPDACIVNGTRTMLQMPWLRSVYPSATLCYYYHGGGLHGAAADDVFPMADLVFTNTISASERLVAMGCPRSKIRVLPVGFDPARYPFTERSCYRPDGVLRLMSASRISEEKGHIYALRALANLRDRGFTDFHYTIIGGGKIDEVDGVKRAVAELRLESLVQFVGEMPTSGVIQALRDADALLLPSIRVGDHAETQAAIVQEAMLLRAGVIVSDVGGVSESIPPFLSEWCVPSASPAAIAEAILKLAHMPLSEFQAQTMAARDWTISHYSTGHINDRLLSYIREFRAGLEELPAVAAS